MRFYSLIILFFVSVLSHAQIVTTSPIFPVDNQSLTITFDAKQANDSRASGLLGLTSGVYIWSGAGSTEDGDAFEFEPTGQEDFNQPFAPGEMTFLGNDVWEITINPRSYFGVPDGTPIEKLGVLFKNANGAAQTENIIIEMYSENEFAYLLNAPSLPVFLDVGADLDIDFVTSQAADITLYIDDVLITSETSANQLTHTEVVSGPGDHTVRITADNGSEIIEENFGYIVRQNTQELARPTGILRGINYDNSDPTKATLCLQAPNKSNVYVLGDFNDWTPSTAYQMNSHGDLFWLEITGLTPGQEYAFQYLVNETIFIADPYADKILNGLDQFIPDNIYPNLKPYPEEANNPIGFYNTVSVLQTDQTEYAWTVNDFVKPESKDLLIYELLIRDFFGNGEESYQNLIDTLSYISDLGFNAIELMPITEFSGNDSWGYNPNFMFAPDKAYGTKNDLKAFIDKAHELGIAVILDMVLNQQEQPSPLILLDFDLSTSQVTAENPYFNVTATHPFNVFYDMNHESQLTMSFVDTVNHYWLNEYRFDGFRFDLSKGFTQTEYGDDVNAWSSYDAGRVATLKRMADEIWVHTPDAYVILEHFADNSEETELANYGMMLWGNQHFSFEQNIIGNVSDISGLYHENRGWNDPNLVGYMESHDEERQVKIALDNGFSLDEVLQRMKLAHTFLFMVPGPKMIWQFGELGYDVSINQNGRTGQKPTPWDASEGLPYYINPDRTRLKDVVSHLTSLRLSEAFNNADFELIGSSSFIKQIKLTNQSMVVNPTSGSEMSIVVVGNFSDSEGIANVSFPFSGEWYHYFDTLATIDAGTSSETFQLQPGELRIYTNFKIEGIDAELLDLVLPLAPDDLNLSDTPQGISLTWNNNSSIANGVRIYRRSGGGDWNLIDTEDAPSNSYTDRSVSPDQSYEYRISSFTTVGESFSSIEEIIASEKVLGIEYESELVYPNPTTDFITIETEDTLDSYVIYQEDGRVLDSGKMNEKNEISLLEIPSGVIIVETISSEGKRKITRVIKN